METQLMIFWCLDMAQVPSSMQIYEIFWSTDIGFLMAYGDILHANRPLY